jgi:hypothetical protein
MSRSRGLSARDRQIGLVFIVIGVGSFLSALFRLGNPGDFMPSDPRSQPGYNESVVSVMLAIGFLSRVIGLAYLYRHRGP